MAKLITLDDFIDTYCKLIQRGKGFIFSKFTFNNLSRTKSAFDNTAVSASNWWIIPKVRQRWNFLISGDKNINYKQYLVSKYLKNQKNLKLLSLGSGVCSHELELAEYKEVFKEITCVDIASNLLDIAIEKAKSNHLNNIKFICKSIYEFDLKENEYDVVLFNSSLHHFDNIDVLLSEKIKHTLKPKGNLIINEFVGATRHQFSKEQLLEINSTLNIIPKKYRRRFKTNLYKNQFRGVGLLRMIVSDPSECIDSSSIIPSVHKHFTVIEEKAIGGNLLANVLRDISHHFLDLDAEKEQVLENLFKIEDKFLESNSSDFVLGFYENKA
ncbi:methyltransferase domain-containing protein [Polaribacter sp. PL03]|uniref:class I SAM-dependent methyltransferase n=1 Tax=Polaribacter sp. PL03 TaxID=3088353 RepID=UPI0029D17E77|nr:methyltransferase domain-containing protein [Polaribacter sp. PL03]MDX6746505.1 methyltransferase domain-containing protein [Polaribacter sp. PL03]